MVEIRASLPTAAIAAVFDIDTVELCAANISSLLTAYSKTAKTLSLPPRTEKMKPEDQHPGGSTWWVNVRL